MSFATVVFVASLAYLGLLFAVAYLADRRAAGGAGVVANPTVYALSIAVYCTSWTFYGSVGRAAASGLGFLPIYLGPTLVFMLAPFLLRKIVRIAKIQHSTSIADFIASRYGKSQTLAGLVTVVAVIGILPYISLQLKAVSRTFDIVSTHPEPMGAALVPIHADTAFYVALILAAFTILFGTRRIDASEHHEGVIVAIAFESVVKLLAFLAVGVFVTFGLFDGFADIFDRAAEVPELAALADGAALFAGDGWLTLTLLSMAAIICLPRQFQVTVVENVNEDALDKAMWLFPLYLLLINLFVLPIAFGGLLTFSDGSVDADTFVLTLPLAAGNQGMALLAFIGGLSAATGMVIVATISLSTMISNDLVVPVLLRAGWLESGRRDMTRLLKLIRRLSIVIVLLLGFLYVRLIGDSHALVTIGLLSFAAAAQFAPLIIGGIYWKGATRAGALSGLLAGFAVWFYCLMLPSFALSGWLPESFVHDGPFGIALLKPYALFGLEGFSTIGHGLFWSMLANLGCYGVVSVLSRQSAVEAVQAEAFVDVMQDTGGERSVGWSGSATVGELQDLAARYIGPERAKESFTNFEVFRNTGLIPSDRADGALVRLTERLVAGVVGAASARVIVMTAANRQTLHSEDVLDLIDEASQIIETSREVLNAVVENVGQGISMFDKDLKLVTWNRRLLELLDLPEQLMRVGTPLEEHFRFNASRGEYGEGDAEEQVRVRIEMARRMEPHRFERIRPDGKVLEIQGGPVPGGGFVTTYTDVTARKAIEEELRQARDELEKRVEERTLELATLTVRLRIAAEEARRANEAKSDFLSSMSHELRTPLNAVLGFTQLLKYETVAPLTDQQREYVDIILGAGEHLLGLINEVLDLAKIESGKLTVDIEDVDPAPLLAEVAEMIAPLARDKGISITYIQCGKDGAEIDAAAECPWVRADRGRLKQVLVNLASNAVKYNRMGGSVKLSCRMVGDERIRFAVEDTGFGIPDDKIEELFQPFNRDIAEGSDIEGTGIGLTITQKLVQLMDAEVAVDSTVGVGSTFHFDLPRGEIHEHDVEGDEIVVLEEGKG